MSTAKTRHLKGAKPTVPLPIIPVPSTPDLQATAANTRLQREVQQQLLRLSFPAFATLVQEVLKRSGYERVVVAGRLSPQGRILHGGCDLKAYTRTDLETVVTAVQLKQYQEPVGRRFLDELRGAMLRLGAEQGLLITTSTFSPAVRKIARESEVAPVRLVDGSELTGLIIQHRLGLREQAGRWRLDGSYFKELEQSACPTLSDAPLLSQKLLSDQEKPTGSPLITHPHINAVPPLKRRNQKGSGMTWSTHALIGINTLWLAEALPPAFDPLTIATFNIGVLAACAAFGALLPDLDASQSKIKYLGLNGWMPFYWPAQVLHRHLGHRGVLHSLVGLGLAACLVLPLAAWWGWPGPLAVLSGYASHLAADACTRSGIPFLYPRKRRYHLLPRPLRFVTGSSAEDALFAVCAVFVLLLLLRHLTPLYEAPF
ncbi:MAG: metal-dependent hydrolase [Abitibacteriaceae bacterium]|nr:metal-dependent hydrolase [Abditibacteriaceae bacterium]